MLESAAAGLPPPSMAALVSHWDLSPFAIVVGLAALIGYARARRRIAAWPIRRSAAFGFGVLLALWTTCGGLAAYGSSLFWAWTTQFLLLLVVVPVLVLAGAPVELARQAGSAWLPAAAGGQTARLCGSPWIGPLLIPVASALLFFGPVSGWAIDVPAFDWVLQLLAVLVGALVVLPLLDIGVERPSLYAGLTLVVGVAELILDAIPGIVLRLQTHVVAGLLAERRMQAWSGSALHDQQTAGTVLWSVAELIDLPFLVIAFVGWMHHDQREADWTDAQLDHAAAAMEPTLSAELWWETEPQLQGRIARTQAGKE